MKTPPTPLPINALRAAFGDALQENVPLARHTTARVGGPADALLEAGSAAELEQIARRLWELDAPFFLLGYGSNVLVADSGLRSVVVLNRAREIRIEAESNPPAVWAESGALIGTIARQAALNGLSGFEWAATVPGIARRRSVTRQHVQVLVNDLLVNHFPVIMEVPLAEEEVLIAFREATALVTVERDDILWHGIVSLQSNSAVVVLPILDTFTPDVLVSIVLVPPDSPTLRIGYTRLRVQKDGANQSDSPAQISVKTASGLALPR